MTLLRLRYVHRFRDRHGRIRHYARVPGQKQVPLPGAPGSEEFMAAYAAALAAEPMPIGSSRSKPGSVSSLIAAYYSDVSFRALAAGTQGMRRAILERFRSDYGDRRVGLLQRVHLVTLIGQKKPFAARNWLKTLRGLMQYGVAAGHVKSDPTVGLKARRAQAGEIHSWTETEIEQYESHHPVGSRSRLAMALLLYTAQRRSDVIRMGRQHIKDGMLTVRQQKTGRTLQIPVHPHLAVVLAATTSEHLTFLTTAAGEPFSAAGFGNLFRSWCDDAALPKHCSAHGLRKAACRRLAEAGCSEHQIASISGMCQEP